MVKNVAYRIKNGGQDASKALYKVEQELPELKRGQVLVEVKAVSLNYRDIMVLKGLYPGTLPTPIPTSDMSGIIISIGPDVTQFKIGDAIIPSFSQSWLSGPSKRSDAFTSLGAPIDGVLSKYRIFEEKGLAKMPKNLTFEEASTLPCAGVTAYKALYGFDKLVTGQSVLILGTGGVSMFGLQLAAAAGARVIVTSSSDEKLARAKALGATDLINYRKTPEWEQEVLKITDGQGVDKILEIGGSGTLAKSMACVKINGTVYEIGFLAQPTNEINWIGSLVFQCCNLQGIMVGSLHDLETLIERFIVAKDIHPIVDKVFEFDEADKAYKYLESGSHFGKVVIRVSQ